MTKSALQIIIRGFNPSEVDKYASLEWKPLPYDAERQTTDGRKVFYEWFHDGSGQHCDMARARLVGREGLEAMAYIQRPYSDDSNLDRKLNRMLGIKVKRLGRKKGTR